MSRPSPRRRRHEDTSIYGSSYPPSSGFNSPLHQPTRLPLRSTKLTQKLVLFPLEDLDERIESAQSDVQAPTLPILEGAAQSLAERLHKSDRQQVPRVTSFCLAESFKFDEIIDYLQNSHGLTPTQYDECLYFYYEGGMKERMFGVPSTNQYHIPMETSISNSDSGAVFAVFPPLDSDSIKPENPAWLDRGEIFLFDYGVLVMWNFTEHEERAFLAHMRPYGVNILPIDDMEIEDFHFQYDITGPYQPRIFNDMITLKSSSPLIKLTISHGLSQSAKLSLFENGMEETITGAVPLPKMLAQYGVVKMNRKKIMKIIGNLYKLRMNVNLISNVLGILLLTLDTPEMFWSEPGLEGLYTAIRGYLEISQRVVLLNTRADVLADLLSMLSDHLNSSEMTYITWIVIILICVAAFVAAMEVVVKLLRLKAGLPDM